MQPNNKFKWPVLLFWVGVIVVLVSQNALAVEVNYTISNGRFNGMELANSLANWRHINFSMTPKFGDSILFNSSSGGATGYYLWNSSARIKVKEGHNKTWEGWAYLNLSISSSQAGLFELCTGGVSVLKFSWSDYVGGGNNLTLVFAAQNTSLMQTRPYKPELSGKGWFHWAIEYYNATIGGTSKSYVRAYFNGTRFLSINNTRLSAQSVNQMVIGGLCSTGANWRGGVDEVRISNMTRYNNTFTPPSSPFINDTRTIALYHFNMANFTLNRPSFNKSVILNVTSNNRFNAYLRNAIIGKVIIKPRLNSTKWNYTLYWNGAGSFFNFSSFINNLPVGTYDAMAVYGGIGSRWNRTSLTGVSYEVTLPTKVQLCNASSVGNTFVAYNFSFYDETNRSKFKNITKLEASFNIKDLNNVTGIKTLNLSITNPKYISICLQPKHHSFKINTTIKYEKNGWNYRHYYLYQDIINSTVLYRYQNKSLYLLKSSLGTLIILKITDSLDAPLKDIITEVQKFFIANNSFVTIGMTKSGEDGQDAIYLQQNEIDYRFNIFQNGKSVKLTTGQKLTAATYTIKIIPSTLTDLVNNVRDLITNMTYNNHTKTFRFGYFDPNSKMAGACLQSSISNRTGTYFKVANCSYGTFRGFLYSRPGNSTPSTSYGYGYVIFNGTISNWGKQGLAISQGLFVDKSKWGLYGIFLVMMLIVGVAMTQIASPVSTLVAVMVVLFSTWWMGILSLTTGGIMALMIVLGIVIKELRSG